MAEKKVVGRLVNTVSFQTDRASLQKALADIKKVKDAMKGQIPMKRFGNTEEIATTAVFLASQEYITGQTIAIDGGLTMQ